MPMRLLVSVRDEVEAAAALAGGADIIDAKDPSAGPLGRVSLDALRAIVQRVGGLRPLTAALGDAAREQDVERDAAAFVATGADVVKVGFAGIADVRRIQRLIAAAVSGAHGRVIAVAYADHRYAESADPEAILGAAIPAGAAGMLVDTADKHGPGLFALMSADAVHRVVSAAHGAGLLAALAGRLAADDLLFARETGADVAGVRGAACDGGRTGCISADRIAHLLHQLSREKPFACESSASASVSAQTIVATMCDGTA
jgi:uncharacterized protein (UPF0264 family)